MIKRNEIYGQSSVCAGWLAGSLDGRLVVVIAVETKRLSWQHGAASASTTAHNNAKMNSTAEPNEIHRKSANSFGSDDDGGGWRLATMAFVVDVVIACVLRDNQVRNK